MKTYRSTYILLGLFFASLVGFWGLEYAGVRTERERRLRETHVLPELLAVAEANIVQLAIDRGPEHLVFKRRGQGIGRWQMVEPTDVAAEPTRLETLVRNLKDLRRSIDSGKVTGAAADYGLAPPAATIRVWAGKPEEGNKRRPAPRHARYRQDRPRRPLRAARRRRRNRGRRKQALDRD